MRSGRSLTVNLPTFGLVNVAFLIQSVTESGFTPALLPRFSAQASSVRFTFEDYLRMLKEGQSLMAAVTIPRTAWIDDDGTGTTGTVLNNAVKTELYNQIDTALARRWMRRSIR